MKNFRFSVPTEIFFGKSSQAALAEQISRHGGTRVLICYGSSRIKESGLFAAITTLFSDRSISWHEFGGIEPNPRINSAREGIRICKDNHIDFLLAVGGGSIIDCTKAIAAGFYFGGDPWDFFTRQAQVTNALPLATILTVAATGSEMNGNSVMTNWDTREKRAVGSDLLKPKFSILDPEYTCTVPANQTAAGVVDIMSHVFEYYFSTADDIYLQSRLAEAILSTAIHYGPVALEQPDNYEARANLLWASSLALNGLLGMGEPGDWAVHAIEHAVSGVSDITHGVGLAIIIPAWMEFVLDGSNKMKFFSLAVTLFQAPSGQNETLTAKSTITKIREFFSSLGMPKTLREVGIREEQLEEIAQKAVRFGPVGNLKKLAYADVYTILKKAL